MSNVEKNICQYWVENEPSVCSKWDATTNVCTEVSATYYPRCNSLGSQAKCNKYDGEGKTPRCVLPDPSRHVGNRKTGSKWVVSDINGYNTGQCDGAGTDTTCSGYSPYHLGFSSLQPDDKDGSLGIDTDGFSAVSGTRLPLGYDVYNERSNLSRCYWWLDDPALFEVDTTTGYIKNITSKCTNTDETVDQFKGFEWDEGTGMYRAPCNGCKPECPFYTGVCWQYCIDEKMQHGDKVLAEQILELRYHIRRNRWTAEDFENAFIEPILYGWQGPPEGIELKYMSGGSIDNWSINAIRAEITDFDDFIIDLSTVRLTRGTSDQEGLPERATLVRELQSAILKPIVRNVFDKDEFDHNIFEVASLDHEKILIFGDTFWYNVLTYGINLSDPDLDFLPSELKLYDSMEDIKAAKSEESYEEFITELDTIITNLLQYYPEKITETEFGKAMNMFYLDMPTVWGENIILVLNKGNGTWEFDKISVEKLFCGGVIGQQSFSLRGDEGKTIDYLPAYERNFNCYTNENGSISFNFCSFVSARGDASNVSYVYNDYVHKQIPADPYNPPAFATYYMGYQLCKVTAYIDLELEDDNVKFFGNAGYALVVVPDEDRILSNVIRNWEVDDDIILEVTGDDYEGIAGNDGGVRTIEMEIYEQGTDRLETNQIIIRPKDIKDFKTPCNLTLKMGNVYVYQKRSFDELPTRDYEVVRESFLGVDDVASYRNNVDLIDAGNEQYELTKFGNDTLFISVIFTGAISGRIKGVTRTKMITWVRQPFCRDVEIKYIWSASYKHATLQPERVCYGPTSFEWDSKIYGKIYMPNCGDHDLGSYSLTGPMWYPYEACADTANYPLDSLTGRVTGVHNWLMELYEETNESAEPIYGNWNMRMLGPQEQSGYVCDNHASLWDCTCDWSYCNLYKEGENLFTGYGRYRCGLSLVDQMECTKNGGQLPKFGNPYRDFIMSYRSIDSVYYYYIEGTNFTRLRKWMPLYEFYTNADITKGSSSYPYDIYSKDITSPFIHPMGLLLANGSIEGITINEQIDVDDDGVPTRHHFEDIFRTHSTTQSIMYPYPTNMKYQGIGMDPILTWYTYRDYPGGDTSKSIQWAWQEIWKDIERQGFSTSLVLPVEESDSIDDVILSKGYEYDESGSVSSKFLFCTVDYPDYKYDYKIGEHRLICEESEYDINITVPIRNDEGEYESPYFFIQLGTGPERMFDADGNWDPTSEDNIYYDLYTTCTTSPWSTDITLFAPGYTDKTIAQAEADDRVIVDYDYVGDEIKTYYQRGLNVTLVPSKFSDFLPREKTLIDSGDYEVRFSHVPSCTGGEEFDEIELAEWYPMPYCVEMPYCCSEGNVEFEFEFVSKKVVEHLICDFKFGAEEIEKDVSWRLYHIPAISVFRSTDGVSYTLVHTDSSSMVLSTNTDEVSSKRITIDWDEDTADLLEPYLYFKIKLRVNPTADEISIAGISDYYDGCENVVHFECNYIYDSVFVDAIESISMYERKYNISYGHHGDFPPHGYDSTGSLLYTRTKENSTVYQRDSVHGVVGMTGTAGENKTMNKVRGRIMLECHEDKEPLPGSTLSNWEKEQKDICDTISIDSGNTSINFISTAPPGMEEKLNEANVSFPYSWTCTFDNTIILPLTEVKWYDPYGPCGQEFYWDLSNLHWQHRCAGSTSGMFSIGSREVWKYKFHSVCGDLDVGTYDAINVYIHSISDLLNSILNYVGFQSPTYSQAASERETNYTMPPPVSAY